MAPQQQPQPQPQPAFVMMPPTDPNYMQAYSQPYPQQPMQPTPQMQETKVRVFTKAGFHVFGIILSIIGLGVSLSVVNEAEAYIIPMIAAPVFGVAIIFSAAELITLAVRRFKTGMHPGVLVAFTLILWTGAITAAGFGSLFNYWIDEDYYCDYSYGYSSYGSSCDDINKTKVKSLGIATEVLLALVAVLFFGLFVVACIDTQRYNTLMRQPIIIYQQLPPGWGVPAQVAQPYYPVQPQPQQTKGTDSMMQSPPMQQQQQQQPPQSVSPDSAPAQPANTEIAGYYSPNGSGAPA